MQTQSFVFDKSISINREKRANYWNQNNPFNIELKVIPNKNNELHEDNQAKGGFGSLYPSKDHSYYYVHSWIYSLAATPIYYIFKSLNLDEYRTFQFFNCTLLALTLYEVNLILGIFILCSPLAGYIRWSSPEIFQFFCLSMGFNLLEKKKTPLLAIFLIALAVAQNFPSLAYLVLAFFLYRKQFDFKNKINLTKICAISLLATLPWIYYTFKFGTPNLILSLGQADPKYASIERLFSFIFSPTAGAFFYFPAAFILLPILERNKAILIFAIVLLLSYSMTGMLNLHSQQIACQRYLTWILAPIFGILLAKKTDHKNHLLFLLLTSAIILFNQNYLFLLNQHHRSYYLSPLSSRVERLYRLSHFPEIPEILVEIIKGSELLVPHQFNKHYELPLNNKNSICLVSLRSYRKDPLLKESFRPHEKLCGKLRERIKNQNEITWKNDPALGSYILSYENK